MEKYYFDESEYDEGIPSITTGFDGEYPSIVDRYFTRFFLSKKTPETNDNEDHIVLFHSNRLYLIGLAKSHIAFTKGIKSISYNIGNCDRSHNQVKGKKKKGGMNLQPSTAIAIVTCKDNSEYKIISCITGRLIEVNDRLVHDLEKLSIEGTGYIAVILCKPENCDKIKNSLVFDENYSPS